MGLSIIHSESNLKMISSNTKVLALESSLQQSLTNFRELVLDFEQQHLDSENYKIKYLSLKNKCDNNTCNGSEELKKVIASKEQIIKLVVSTLTKLNETKNFNILTEAFKILCEEETTPLTHAIKDKQVASTSVSTEVSPTNNNICGKKEIDTSLIEDVSYKEESLSEIDGTPGRTSPIIHTKRTRSTLANSSDFRDKKKCPDDWPSPGSKAIKLTFPTPSRNKSGSGKLRQSRLNVVKVKQTNVVDLTCSPEVGLKEEPFVQLPIKKESIENDDTILPSPTSGPTKFTLLKTSSKGSPCKFKKPPLSLKNKGEHVTKQDENKGVIKNTTHAEMDKSINISNQFGDRLKNGIKKENKPIVKMKQEPPDEDMTDCETNASISLLHHIAKQEQEKRHSSPTKRPLAENVNIMNTPPKNEAESSMSILRPETIVKPNTAALENVKRRIPELAEPVYKEAAVRKKAEKRNLQGWSCEECENFFGEMYKNDPVMLAKKINECSKHRGRHNPARPKTPPNFWNPRWHVPTDTEELNRMNNADA